MRLSWGPRDGVDHELIWGTVGLALVAAAMLLPVDKVLNAMGYRCPFRTLIGLPCPSCYGTRAWMAMSHLRFADGFALNPLAALACCAAALFAPYGLTSSLTNANRLRVAELGRPVRLAVGVLLVLVVLTNWLYLLLCH